MKTIALMSGLLLAGTLTATGGPSTPGAADVGRLAVAEAISVVTPQGDASTVSPRWGVDLQSQPYLPGRDKPVVWSFGTDDPASYDVATFTVEYRHFVPVNG